MNANKFINIFGMQGIEHFIQTGHLPGVLDQYFSVEKIEDRRDMIENFHQHLLNRTRRFYMVNEKNLRNAAVMGLNFSAKIGWLLTMWG